MMPAGYLLAHHGESLHRNLTASGPRQKIDADKTRPEGRCRDCVQPRYMSSNCPETESSPERTMSLFLAVSFWGDVQNFL